MNFIIILFISFSVTGISLYIFTEKLVLKQKIDLLSESGDDINNILKKYIEDSDSLLSQKISTDIIKFYSNNVNSIIWIANKEGYLVVYNEKDIPDNIYKKLLLPSHKVRLSDSRQYKEVMTGKYNIISERGDFYGLFSDTKVPWLTIERPFVYNGTVEGAVYLSTPIPEIVKARNSVIKLFGLSVLISVLVSVIIAFISSRKISKPLMEINTLAKQIAGGHFDKRLNIDSYDEIGELAVSFNNMAFALENTDSMRKEFIANVSHELRTPMTSIKGFVDGILDGTIPPDKQKYYLDIVKEEISRLNKLVTDLLDLTKMESGENRLNIVKFSINELIRKSIIKFESLIVKKEIQIRANFEDEDTYVYADIDSIERVIINLMHNAIKFTGNRGMIIISITKERGKIFISIEDNGMGIAKEYLDRIWERFYKTDKSRPKGAGTGLGLAIVKTIINDHNEKIWVISDEGRGTKFTFTLKCQAN